MNILSVCVLAVVTVIIMVMLKPKNGEIALMLGLACSVLVLFSVLSQVPGVIETINSIIAASQISTGYVVILLKVIGICVPDNMPGFVFVPRISFSALFNSLLFGGAIVLCILIGLLSAFF